MYLLAAHACRATTIRPNLASFIQRLFLMVSPIVLKELGNPLVESVKHVLDTHPDMISAGQ